MRILALDCSAISASCAVLEDEKIIASSYANVKLTHSETLLPMLENTLAAAKLSLGDIDALAINSGPGSFTGIRIGISAVKGIAEPRNLPCASVSTLYSIACLHKNFSGVVLAAMDARCNQVYSALFKTENGVITRLCEDKAVLVDEIINELDQTDDNIIIAGDGAALFSDYAKKNDNIKISNEPNLYQNAIGVAIAAKEILDRGEGISAEELSPVYLRLPQAERELKAKNLSQKGE